MEKLDCRPSLCREAIFLGSNDNLSWLDGVSCVDGKVLKLAYLWFQIFLSFTDFSFNSLCPCLLFHRFLPGACVEGTLLPNGKKLSYVMSGHLQFWVTLVLIFYGVPHFLIQTTSSNSSVWSGVISIQGFSALDLTLVYEYYAQLITASVLFSFLLSFYLFFSSYWGDKILAKGGDTPSPLYNFFIGRELNPRIGSLDLKEFCELRPGLIGWAVINLAMAVTQYTKNSQAGQGYISLSMLCIVFLQGQYVWDGLYNEPAILSTMDITTDGFGYMLAFGDLAWVPFIYSLQARYLVDHDPQLSLMSIICILLLHSFGFYIFRAANSQKDAFRRDPSSPEVQHLTFLATKRGTKLLTSGWWGMARKINYTGDWIITFAWCLLCGFDSPVPYFQALYFAVLLYHR
ncbi:hypothetical protein EON65_00755 [archaeon]|nr:MAG: hypothetical protein EON65_00755 [archaeon]